MTWRSKARPSLWVASVARAMKWVHRLFSYALELEIIETHPMYGFKMETSPSRDMVWSEW